MAMLILPQAGWSEKDTEMRGQTEEEREGTGEREVAAEGKAGETWLFDSLPPTTAPPTTTTTTLQHLPHAYTASRLPSPLWVYHLQQSDGAEARPLCSARQSEHVGSKIQPAFIIHFPFLQTAQRQCSPTPGDAHTHSHSHSHVDLLRDGFKR